MQPGHPRTAIRLAVRRSRLLRRSPRRRARSASPAVD
jgi:hypothetical protein